jgi:hypothetical protein
MNILTNQNGLAIVIFAAVATLILLIYDVTSFIIFNPKLATKTFINTDNEAIPKINLQQMQEAQFFRRHNLILEPASPKSLSVLKSRQDPGPSSVMTENDRISISIDNMKKQIGPNLSKVE